MFGVGFSSKQKKYFKDALAPLKLTMLLTHGLIGGVWISTKSVDNYEIVLAMLGTFKLSLMSGSPEQKIMKINADKFR